MPEHPRDGSAAGVEIPARNVLSYEDNSSALAAISLTVSMWLDRRRRRQALQDLAERNNYLLADVGLTQEEALREAAKPFWQR